MAILGSGYDLTQRIGPKGFRSIDEDAELAARMGLGVLQAQESSAAAGNEAAARNSQGNSPSQQGSTDEAEAGLGYRGASGSNAPPDLANALISASHLESLRSSSRTNLLDIYNALSSAQAEQLTNQQSLVDLYKQQLTGAQAVDPNAPDPFDQYKQQLTGQGSRDNSLQQIRGIVSSLSGRLKPIQKGSYGQGQQIDRNVAAFNSTASKLASAFGIEPSAASNIILDAISLEPNNPVGVIKYYFNKGK